MFSQAETTAAFARDPKPVAAWLDDLIGDDPTARRVAGDVLWLTWIGGLPADAPPDPMERFATETRRWLDDDARRGRAWERCVALVLADADLHRRKMAVEFNDHARRQDRQYDRVTDRLNAKLDHAGPAEAEVIRGRMHRALAASLDRDAARWAAADALGETSGNDRVIAGFVLEADAARLVAGRPDLVRRLRDDDQADYTAAKILEAAGPAAAPAFLDPLLIEFPQVSQYGNGRVNPTTLAAVGGDAPRAVAALIGLVRSRGPAAGRAAATLRAIGRRPTTRPVARLHADLLATGDPGDRWHAATLVGCLADRAAAVDDLLAMTHGDAHEAGEAILRLADAAPAGAARAVARLIELFDAYEDYDPDYQYEGTHTRVCHALAAYGPRAAPAAGRLAVYLRACIDGDHDDFPKDALQVIAAIGPPAADLLPLLWELRGASADEEPLDPDPLLNPLDAAIAAVTGRSYAA